MGGTKKKTLASMDKSQDEDASAGAGGEKGKKKTEQGRPGERRKVDVLPPRMSEQEMLRSLTSLRAITVYGAARSLAVNAAVAKGVLSSLESKGLLKRAGGFSGHYVWTAAS